MAASGKITRINSDLGYGFVQVPKVGDVFFSSETRFDGTAFESLKINDFVRIEITETERGLFASTLSLSPVSKKTPPPEASI